MDPRTISPRIASSTSSCSHPESEAHPSRHSSKSRIARGVRAPARISTVSSAVNRLRWIAVNDSISLSPAGLSAAVPSHRSHPEQGTGSWPIRESRAFRRHAAASGPFLPRAY